MNKVLIGGLIISGALFMAAPAFAWDGVNIDTGSAITIEDGTAVAEGNDIQILDIDTGAPRGVTIDSITQTDSAIEIAVIDDTSGETQTYDFDPSDMPPEVDLPEPQ